LTSKAEAEHHLMVKILYTRKMAEKTGPLVMVALLHRVGISDFA